MSTNTEQVAVSATKWTPEQKTAINAVFALVKARVEGGYPDLSSDCGVTMEVEGEEVTLVPYEDFAKLLLEELDDVSEQGPSYLEYLVAEAKGDVRGMMGLKEAE